MKKHLIPMMLMMNSLVHGNGWSSVEKEYLQASAHQGLYPSEKVKVLEVEDYYQLGRLTAYRFLEWARQNPNGVVSLPTGRTPEAFIAYMRYLKQNWNHPDVQAELASYGLAGPMPDTSGLRFVQMDEFYPIDPNHANSFRNYIRTYYLPLFGIREENALLMDVSSRGVLGERGIEAVFPGGSVDLSLLSRPAVGPEEQLQRRALEEANAFAQSYENKIREWGGIGFFLGGLGTDGHIAFITPTSPSRTHLTQLTYVQAAQSAVALGGISRSKGVAVTIGIDTITSKNDAAIIIMVAGEGKAPAVKRAVEGEMTNDFPASRLQGRESVRFFVTGSAAKDLSDRKLEDVEKLAITDSMVDDVIIDLALRKNKQIKNLTGGDIERDRRGGALVRRMKTTPFALKDATLRRLIAKIERGITPPEGKRILHTGPHHDDVMLSYFGLLPTILGRNGNLFVYLTSGFNSVSDSYMKRLLTTIVKTDFDQYDALESPYAIVLARALRAARAHDQEQQDQNEAIILMRHIGIVYNDKSLKEIRKRANWLLGSYFAGKKPGEKDIPAVQILKGAMRESEEDRHMTVQGVPVRDVYHLRSDFYTGDYFNPLPTIEKDAKPMQEIIDSFKPHIITVAMDPEGTGPDTHYKVLEIVAQAAAMSETNPIIWGYRNVWHRFTIAESDIIAPVSDRQLTDLNECFNNCYTTQKEAEYPPLEHNGTFAELSVIIQKQQLDQLQKLLGSEFFQKHPDSAIQNAKGLLFLKTLDKETFTKGADLVSHAKT